MEYLKGKGLNASLKAVYSNASVAEGGEQIKKLKPVAGIISLEAYLTLADQEPIALLLQTRKLPRADGTAQYRIVKNKNGTAPETLWLAEPLGPDFTKNVVLSSTTEALQSLPEHYTDQVLYKLKQVGQGELKDAVLISDYQEAVLHQLPSDWAKNLEVVASSPVLPAPPLVLFTKRSDSFPSEELVQLLLKMDQDPEGQQILQELRLAGFMKPDAEAYGTWQKSSASPAPLPQ